MTTTPLPSDFTCPSCGDGNVHAVGLDGEPITCMACAFKAEPSMRLDTPEGRTRAVDMLLKANHGSILSNVREAVRAGEPIEDLAALIIEHRTARRLGYPPLAVAHRAILAPWLGDLAHHLVPTGRANHIPVVIRVGDVCASTILEITLPS